MIPAKLPKPDEYGNYWLGSRPKDGPAILSSALKKGRWIASTGYRVLGFKEDKTIQYFATPEAALEALRNICPRSAG